MSEGLTMVAMLAITAGAALFVAWPLMFGGARPEDFFDLYIGELQTQRSISRGGAMSSKNELEFEPGSKPRADLDVELEIEAFRRHSRHIKARDDRTGGQ